MTLVSSAGYIVAVYSSTGILDANSLPVAGPVVRALLLAVPDGLEAGLGVGRPARCASVAVAILLVTIPLALWLAARFYAAGVLMYGQRPSLRLMLRVLRGAR